MAIQLHMCQICATDAFDYPKRNKLVAYYVYINKDLEYDSAAMHYLVFFGLYYFHHAIVFSLFVDTGTSSVLRHIALTYLNKNSCLHYYPELHNGSICAYDESMGKDTCVVRISLFLLFLVTTIPMVCSDVESQPQTTSSNPTHAW